MLTFDKNSTFVTSIVLTLKFKMRYNIIILTTLLISTSLIIAGCSTNQGVAQTISGEQTVPLAIQVLQTRTFHASNVSVYNAIVNTFSDLNLIVQGNASNSSVISASGVMTVNGVPSNNVNASVLITNISEDETRVRINVLVNSAISGNPELYNILFNRIDTHLFIEGIL